MTECWRISTPSRSASSAALRSGRTLKPMMIASDAEASRTSERLMAPTPEWMIRTLTFSSESLASVSASTSAEPCTSALTRIGSSLTLPSAILSLRPSSVRRGPLAPSARSRAWVWRNEATCRAFAWSAMTWKVSPGAGRPVEAEHLDRRRRAGQLHAVAAVVDERAHLADDRPRDDRVADAQRAVLHEHGGHRAAALVELGFEHGAVARGPSGSPSARRCRSRAGSSRAAGRGSASSSPRRAR